MAKRGGEHKGSSPAPRVGGATAGSGGAPSQAARRVAPKRVMPTRSRTPRGQEKAVPKPQPRPAKRSGAASSADQDVAQAPGLTCRIAVCGPRFEAGGDWGQWQQVFHNNGNVTLVPFGDRCEKKQRGVPFQGDGGDLGDGGGRN